MTPLKAHLLVVVSLAAALRGGTTAAPYITSFSFNCADGGPCPKGPYQQYCPIVWNGPRVGGSGGYLSGYCFAADSTLSPLSIVHDLVSCTSGRKNILIADPSGQLQCSKKNQVIRRETPPPTDPNIALGSRVYFKFQCRTNINSYLPSQLDTSCPAFGEYKKTCPLCMTRNNGNTLACLCFDSRQILHPISFLDNIKKCSVIYSTKGKLACRGRVKNSYE